ncbi:MAG TPA: lactate permease LctP family transporter [Bacteroidales bacterium]|nr:lactate permease LctP family transporter [Bacteroidales bacterium]
MNWTQVVDPLNSIVISALVAAIPIVFIFWALIIRKMKGYLASLFTVLIAIILAIIVYRMPVKLALASTWHGALYGLLPICWVIIGAMFLYNVTVKSGQFEIIKNLMASITTDRRLQALLVAFSFGAFLEGAAGMGAPVAITAAMLVGLGFNPLYAAGICLVANTAPVAFGSVGIPVITAAQVAGLPEMTVSQMVGRTLPLLGLIVPLYLAVMMSGFKRSLEVLPAIFVSGIVFALVQFMVSNYINPMLPGILAGLASIVSLVVLLKYWKPKSIWRFKDEAQQTITTEIKYSTAQIFRAWSPFIIMTLMIMAWGMQPVKEALNSVLDIKFFIPGLKETILRPDSSGFLDIKPYDFNILSTAGTATILSAFISLPLIGLSLKDGLKSFAATLNQVKFPIITIASIVGFAFVANNSGMSITIAMALAGTGVLFPFFSPVLGWLGVFLTGSDTSSNALFCKLQYTSAQAIGIDPVLSVGANASGGVTGKMISPQSLAVGAAAVGLVGKESELARFTIKHSLILLLVISVITIIQAYVAKWFIPEYDMIASETQKAVTGTNMGFVYLAVLAAILIMLMLIVKLLNKK